MSGDESITTDNDLSRLIRDAVDEAMEPIRQGLARVQAELDAQKQREQSARAAISQRAAGAEETANENRGLLHGMQEMMETMRKSGLERDRDTQAQIRELRGIAGRLEEIHKNQSERLDWQNDEHTQTRSLAESNSTEIKLIQVEQADFRVRGAELSAAVNSNNEKVDALDAKLNQVIASQEETAAIIKAGEARRQQVVNLATSRTGYTGLTTALLLFLDWVGLVDWASFGGFIQAIGGG